MRGRGDLRALLLISFALLASHFISHVSLASVHPAYLAFVTIPSVFRLHRLIWCVLFAVRSLASTLLFRAACIVMQPDLGVPDEAAEEEIDAFLKSAGIKPVPTPSSAGRPNANAARDSNGLAQKTIISGDMKAEDGNANAIRARPGLGPQTTTIGADVGAGDGSTNAICQPPELARNATPVGDVKAGDGVTLLGDSKIATAEGGLADGQGAAEKEVHRRWLGTEVSAASTLVVLTTAMCR